MKNIKLDNGREYSFVKKVIYNNKEYFYLCDINNYKIYIVVELKNNNYIIVEDIKLLSKLMIEFQKES